MNCLETISSIPLIASDNPTCDNQPVKQPASTENLLSAKRDYFRVSEVARLFGVTSQAVHLWIGNGRIRNAGRLSRRGPYMIPREELADLLKREGREISGIWEKCRVRVLFIDDDPLLRRFALSAARSRAFPMSLKTSATMEDGLLLAGEFRPDVILLDTFISDDLLGVEEGLAFIRHAKLIRKVRTVAMVDDNRTGAKLLKAGADSVLLKPFGLSDLRDAIYKQWKSRTGIAHSAVNREGD